MNQKTQRRTLPQVGNVNGKLVAVAATQKDNRVTTGSIVGRHWPDLQYTEEGKLVRMDPPPQEHTA